MISTESVPDPGWSTESLSTLCELRRAVVTSGTATSDRAAKRPAKNS